MGVNPCIPDPGSGGIPEDVPDKEADQVSGGGRTPMWNPLLSSYRAGENRSTSSTMAVFERLDLALVQELLEVATGSGGELPTVTFEKSGGQRRCRAGLPHHRAIHLVVPDQDRQRQLHERGRQPGPAPPTRPTPRRRPGCPAVRPDTRPLPTCLVRRARRCGPCGSGSNSVAVLQGSCRRHYRRHGRPVPPGPRADPLPAWRDRRTVRDRRVPH